MRCVFVDEGFVTCTAITTDLSKKGPKRSLPVHSLMRALNEEPTHRTPDRETKRFHESAPTSQGTPPVLLFRVKRNEGRGGEGPCRGCPRR